MRKRAIAILLALVMVLGTVAMAVGEAKTISVIPMKLNINGQEVTPTDANGEAVDLFAYEGTTYVPLRYLSELLGIKVEWDANVTDTAKLVMDKMTYSATVNGHNAPMTVKVTVADGKIAEIDYSDNLETIGVGKVALDKVAAKIIDKQTVGVDGVSGATISSMALKNAVKDCLTQAGLTDASYTAEVHDEDTVKDKYTADVVVIGGGGAGLAAAIAAEQKGAKVVVLEKVGILGGSTNVSEGALNAADPKRQGAMGIEDSVENHIKQTYEGGHSTGDMDLITYMCENALGSVEWLESLGVKFKDEIGTATGALFQRSHYTTTPSGNSYIRVFEDYISKSDNIEVLLETPATELITKSGKVTGVKAEHNGREITLTAKKGVVIATGGFGANKEMLGEANTGVWKHVDVTKLGCTNMYKSAQGDGIKMATAVGAGLTGMSDIQLHPCGTPGTGLMENIRTSGRNRIFVNATGDRFVNEGAARDVLAQAILDQEGQTYWIVVNSVRYPARDWADANGATIANMVALGSVVEADTLEELAEKTGMDAAKLKASIDDYNAVVRGEKEDALGFKANNKADVELTTGPWYACKKVPTVHHTMGGLTIDTKAHVLNEKGKVITGLYAAGEVTGGIHGENRLGGNAIADIMTYGRTAGANAATAK